MTTAEQARTAAKAAQEKQEAEAKAQAAALKAGERENTAAEKTADKEAKAAGEEKQPRADAGAGDYGALMARLDAQDRVIQSLTAQSAGQSGPGIGDRKDTSQAAPGSQFDPAVTPRLASGVTSGPAAQPHPTSGASLNNPLPAYDWKDGEVTVWGRRTDGSVIRPREYPHVTEQDVQVTATGYHDDTIRNEGEIIRGYTGPLASWLAPIDDKGRVIPRERFLRDLAEAA